MCQLLEFPSSHIPRQMSKRHPGPPLSLPFPWSHQICIFSLISHYCTCYAWSHFSWATTQTPNSPRIRSSKESDTISAFQSVPWKLSGNSKVLATLRALLFRSYCPCLECLGAFSCAVSNPQLNINLKKHGLQNHFPKPKSESNPHSLLLQSLNMPPSMNL